MTRLPNGFCDYCGKNIAGVKVIETGFIKGDKDNYWRILDEAIIKEKKIQLNKKSFLIRFFGKLFLMSGLPFYEMEPWFCNQDCYEKWKLRLKLETDKIIASVRSGGELTNEN